MHAAKVEKSDRLQRVLLLLQSGGEFSTQQIIRQANVCAVSAIAAELRQQGYDITCRREENRWYYRLNRRDQ